MGHLQGNNGGAVDAGFQYSPTYQRLTLFTKYQDQSTFNQAPLAYACNTVNT